MSSKILLSHHDVDIAAKNLAALISKLSITSNNPKIYCIPRGGVFAGYALKNHYKNITLVSTPAEAEFFLDDLIDSGSTMERYCDEYPGIPFYALFDKRVQPQYKDSWLTFPWEVADNDEVETVENNILRLLQHIGEDPKRGGLLETPRRVAKAWEFWTSGYDVTNYSSLLKVFEDGSEGYDQMVVVKDIPFYSHCEHHLAPFFGTATIAYIPKGKIVGLSKLSRLVDVFARRLQVQERLTNNIATVLQSHLSPMGVGVLIKARHLCMESRGICQQGHHTVTSALRGVIKEDVATRAEFMDLAK